MRSRLAPTVAPRRAVTPIDWSRSRHKRPPKIWVRSAGEPVAYTIVLFSQPIIVHPVVGASDGRMPSQAEKREKAETRGLAANRISWHSFHLELIFLASSSRGTHVGSKQVVEIVYSGGRNG